MAVNIELAENFGKDDLAVFAFLELTNQKGNFVIGIHNHCAQCHQQVDIPGTGIVNYRNGCPTMPTMRGVKRDAEYICNRIFQHPQEVEDAGDEFMEEDDIYDDLKTVSAMQELAKRLKQRQTKYLLGNKVSRADILFWAKLVDMQFTGLNEEEEDYVHAWFNSVKRLNACAYAHRYIRRIGITPADVLRVVPRLALNPNRLMTVADLWEEWEEETW